MKTSVLLCHMIIFAVRNYAPADCTVSVDSLCGHMEVRRAGTLKWIPLKRYEKVGNNDAVRTNEGSFGLIRWPDSSKTYMNEKSVILVTIFHDKPHNAIRQYATFIGGRVFFIVNGRLSQQPFRIYTPVATISSQDASFEIMVHAISGMTTIKMFYNTAQVFVSNKTSSSYVKAPAKVSIDRDVSSVSSIALLTVDIDTTKQWISTELIDREIARNISKGKRDRSVISNKPRDECLILPFTNASSYNGTWDIGFMAAAILCQKLKNASTHLNVYTYDSTVIEGSKMSKERFHIRGSITQFDIVNRAEISAGADEYHEQSVAMVTLQLHINDANDETLPLFVNATGERSGRKNSTNSWPTISGYPFDMSDSLFSSSILGTALNEAMDAVVEKCILFIGK